MYSSKRTLSIVSRGTSIRLSVDKTVFNKTPTATTMMYVEY